MHKSKSTLRNASFSKQKTHDRTDMEETKEGVSTGDLKGRHITMVHPPSHISNSDVNTEASERVHFLTTANGFDTFSRKETQQKKEQAAAKSKNM